MDQPTYTAIPDTSDTTYWIATQNPHDRSISFVPRDKELHRLLKQQAKELCKPTSTYKERKKKG